MYERQDVNRIEIILPLGLAERVEAAMERLLDLRTKEQFAVTAILWALESLDASDTITMMGLDESQ